MPRRTTLVALGVIGAIAGGTANRLVAQMATPSAASTAAALAHPMSFFITGTSIGDGGNLGGLKGADAFCQKLGTAAGRGSAEWHAYLSTQGPGAVNARDRIGQGPWYNAHGDLISADLAQLHGDTLEQAQIGNPLGKVFTLTETGERVNGSGDKPNRHDVLTGSHSDGRAYAAADGDHTCHNWTSDGDGAAQLGHADKQGGGNASWNSAHISKGCSQAALVSTGGEGKLYCFAVRG